MTRKALPFRLARGTAPLQLAMAGLMAGALASACATARPPSPAQPANASSPAAPAADPLVGQLAPDFTAQAQDGTSVKLSAFAGRTVVVYFYPKDETPGCTKEACSFRDAWTALGKTGTVLVGVSADTRDSHEAFAAHHSLPFLLVSDPDGALGRPFGVPFADGRYARQTVVIGPDGKVRKVYRHVDVAVHAQQVLEDVTEAAPAAQPPADRTPQSPAQAAPAPGAAPAQSS